tara:strand:- start:4894 stop:5277 length:384 start_codon:yes stop_codon:yes gene_type:complete
MKVGELIKELQEFDLDEEVCVGNLDIYFLDELPAYYDGNLQRIIKDPEKKHCYSIVGAKVTGKGKKVNLYTMGVEDVILDDPEVPVDLSELIDIAKARWESKVEEYREEIREIERKIEYEQKSKDSS